MAKIKRENKNKAEKHIKGSNKNILGKKTSKPRKTSMSANAPKLNKLKPKNEQSDRYKKKSTTDSTKSKPYFKNDDREKGRSKSKDESFGQGKWKREGAKPTGTKPSYGSPKNEKRNSLPEERFEKKSSFKDFRAKGDKLKKIVPGDRRKFLSTDQKRKLSQKDFSENNKADFENKEKRKPQSNNSEKVSPDRIPGVEPRNESKKIKDSGKKILSTKNNAEKISNKDLPIAQSKNKETKEPTEDDGKIRLNRYISNAGVCSRRDADNMIKEGLIKVNGEVITELGYKVRPEDSVKYGNKILKRERFVYILLNKPKDFITTLDDPEERKTVMDLVKNACTERVYPVGRLDRNTTGLLLLTNDGSLAATLTHPSYEVKKIYQVDLDKPLSPEDFDKIVEGIELEDGPVNVDDIEVVSEDRKIIGLEIHVGRNRIVRRIFEHLGYDVVQLDRVMYAGLTKKDLSRGKWRMLTPKEVIKLKHFKTNK